MRKVFVTSSQIENGLVTIAANDSRHLARVLRKKVGDTIHVAVEGRVYLVELLSVNAACVVGNIMGSVSGGRESPVCLRLFQGVGKGDKMDWVVQKSVELGVAQITPFTSRYSIVKLDRAGWEKKGQRWQRIAIEASKQCQRDSVPQVAPVLGFSEMVQAFKERDAENLLLLAWEGEMRRGLNDLKKETVQQVSLVIGPEGGLTPDEVEQIRSVGGEVITLGPRTLRTETAALVLLSLVGFRWGDLGHGQESCHSHSRL